MKKLFYAIMIVAQAMLLPCAVRAQQADTLAAERGQHVGYARAYNDVQLLYELYMSIYANSSDHTLAARIVDSSGKETYFHLSVSGERVYSASNDVSKKLFNEFAQHYTDHFDERAYKHTEIDYGTYRLSYSLAHGMAEMLPDFDLMRESIIHQLHALYNRTRFEKAPISLEVNDIERFATHFQPICLDHKGYGIKGYYVFLPDSCACLIAGYFVREKEPIAYRACIIFNTKKTDERPVGMHIANAQSVYETLKALAEKKCIAL